VTEYYKKYRPKIFKRVIGQEDAINTLKGLLKKRSKFPHCILFTGPSGCGKTTLAYILKDKLECGIDCPDPDDLDKNPDFVEVDAAEFRGIEMVREIKRRMRGAPIAGKCRIWYLDECHQLTSEAQDSLLKTLEATPKHVYFLLATTNPGKLKRTILTRSTEIKVEPLARQEMDDLIAYVADKEKLKLSEDLVARINECADGSARKALVLLNQVAEIDDEDDKLNAVLSQDTKRQAIEIARTILKPDCSWDKLRHILKAVDEDPEQIRHMMLGYFTSVLLGGGKLADRAAMVITMFEDHFYDSKRAGLMARCYDCCRKPKKR
jgi:DNA polymerase III subunit gamma/tau